LETLADLLSDFLNFSETLKGFFIKIPLIKKAGVVILNSEPWQMLILFILSSIFMLWRLNAVEKKGFEGTMVGTLVMPYCSGFANLAFAFIIGRSGGDGKFVIENCIVNNITNLALILGITALIWGIAISGKSSRKSPESKISYFSNLLTILAMLFFTLIVWVLAKDKVIDFHDGIILTGLFLFWQLFHFFDVMKNNAIKNRVFKKSIYLDLIMVALSAWAIFYSIEKLVNWISENGTGFLSMEHLGLLSGLLMVLPNSILAFYYCATHRSDIAYSSQIGDCHICIPLCIGLSAFFSPISIPESFDRGIILIAGAGIAHFIFTSIMGRIPRYVGAALAIGYSIFLYRDILY